MSLCSHKDRLWVKIKSYTRSKWNCSEVVKQQPILQATQDIKISNSSAIKQLDKIPER